MAPTLCKLVVGCVHPPRHQGPCEVNRPLPIGHAVSFLDQHQSTGALAGRISQELLIVVGANTALFEGGLTREALVLLVAAKCKRSQNGARISEATVELVLDAMARLGEFLA